MLSGISGDTLCHNVMKRKTRLTDSLHEIVEVLGLLHLPVTSETSHDLRGMWDASLQTCRVLDWPYIWVRWAEHVAALYTSAPGLAEQRFSWYHGILYFSNRMQSIFTRGADVLTYDEGWRYIVKRNIASHYIVILIPHDKRHIPHLHLLVHSSSSSSPIRQVQYTGTDCWRKCLPM